MADTDLYQYRPLAEGEIRLAHLTELQGQIIITITHTPMIAAKGRYEALSYVWGHDPAGGERVLCFDILAGFEAATAPTFLRAGRNLRSAMRVLVRRRSDGAAKVPFVWIDAVCINQ